ncbi:MAG TPA: prepilin peptidase [Candidatus Brocadia sapporoensis]|nr:prepilin peptidase [Candidatus Brocadia sapporoensis]
MGLAIGSFLNVCIYRIPRKKSLVSPRSFCPICQTQVCWYDNIPVLSYLLLRGHCRTCRTKISLRYPLIELLTGSLFTLLYIFVQYRQESLCVLVGYLALCCALIISTFVDIEFLVIPNEITFVGIPLAFLFSVVCPCLHNKPDTLRNFTLMGITRLDSLIASLSGALVGGGLIFLCSVVGKWVFRKEAMGFGDVKLMGMVGGMVGWKLAVAIFFVAPFFGLFMGIPVLLMKKTHLIPYGPFLSLATLVCIFFQDYFLRIVDLYFQVFTVLFTGFHT